MSLLVILASSIACLILYSCPPSDCFTTHRLGSIQFSSHSNLFIPCPEDLFSPFFSFFFCFHFLDDTGRDPRLSIPRIKLMTGYSFIFLSFSSSCHLSEWMDALRRATNSMTSVTPAHNSCYCSCLKCWELWLDRNCIDYRHTAVFFGGAGHQQHTMEGS